MTGPAGRSVGLEFPLDGVPHADPRIHVQEMRKRLASARALAGAGLLLLAACATPEQRADEMAAYISENYGPTCAKLGYAAGSEGHRNCMLSMYNTDQIRQTMPAWSPSWGRFRR
jgi:hypothetical protein